MGNRRLGLLLVALAAGGCGLPSRLQAKPERALHVGLATAPISFDPHATNELVAITVNSNIYDTLVATDTEHRLVPRMASRWFNPDDRTWSFDLRPGIRFQDGSALTSADVAFSLLRARNDPLSEWAAGLASIESIETPSPTSVVVHTTAPDATLIEAFAQTLIVPRSAGAIADSPLKRAPVGSGPYRLAHHSEDLTAVELSTWNGYYGSSPAIDRLTFNSIPDDTQRVGALVAGRMDLVSDVASDGSSLIRAARGVNLLEVPSLTLVYIGFDVARARTPYASPARNPFRDARVRRAVLAALDRQRLVNQVLEATGDEAHQIVAPGVFGFDPELPRNDPDPELARRLLAQAGFPGGFSATLDAPATSFVGDARVAPFVSRSLAEIGIGIELRPQSKQELFARMSQRDTSLFIGGWNCSSGDMQEVLDFLLHTPDPSNRWGRENAGGYSNPRVDQLAEEAHRTMGRERRLQLLREAARLALEDVAWVPLYVTRNRYGASDRLRWSPRPDTLILGETIGIAP